MFLGRDKGWWQEKAILFLLLCLGGFLISPNDTTKAAYCGFGFTSYCKPTFMPPQSAAETMGVGEVRYINGMRIERTK